MKLETIIAADIYRDGGSFGAAFTTDDGLGYGLWLERSHMPDEEGLHHRWLFEYRGFDRPKGSMPVVTGSVQEQELIQRLREFLARSKDELPFTNPTMDGCHIERLEEMLRYILLRESCFPTDLRKAGFGI